MAGGACLLTSSQVGRGRGGEAPGPGPDMTRDHSERPLSPGVCCCFLIMGLAVTFLSGTFLSSVQERVKGGDADLEPIDSWLMTQGMVSGH